MYEVFTGSGWSEDVTGGGFGKSFCGVWKEGGGFGKSIDGGAGKSIVSAGGEGIGGGDGDRRAKAAATADGFSIFGSGFGALKGVTKCDILTFMNLRNLLMECRKL